MALFLSTFINKIDKKGRVSFPAPFRAALIKNGQSQEAVIFRSTRQPAIEGCSMERLHRLSESMDRELDLFSNEHEDLAAVLFADATPLVPDQEGRVLLSEALLAFADISDHIAFVGRGHTFQLWNPARFQLFQEAARTRLKEHSVTVRLGEMSQ